MRKRGVIVVVGGEKRVAQFALALSRLLKARCVFCEAASGEPFLVGKRVALALVPKVFAYPFFCIAQDHAFTGGFVAGLVRSLSLFPYLFVLDAHLDLFSLPTPSFPVHRGNFLAYLLERERFPEDRLFVCSDGATFRELGKRIATLPPGLFYLSWDVDFGFPEVAYFPGKVPCACLEELFANFAACCRERKFRFLGGDLVELNPKSIRDPLGFAFRVSRCLAPFFMEEENV
ncbi:MAG: arginase family protein [Candidatus Caldatribacterium sp.]|uniref:hypothetical protein n=1 Tax=Candidatus Caldatribacterium sp. TaxID=2282143 RepID=UPI0029966BF1|nr:arginase family protein [Candidatus Caldatribacterium sp.]MCX7731031.1 arginase family protein [Candidatus Caldatribacterium sp.]MDW8081650.1 hypothetical protein [Candidatus Calescibacterium sp.]